MTRQRPPIDLAGRLRANLARTVPLDKREERRGEGQKIAPGKIK
jgi:hypothetical protein